MDASICRISLGLNLVWQRQFCKKQKTKKTWAPVNGTNRNFVNCTSSALLTHKLKQAKGDLVHKHCLFGCIYDSTRCSKGTSLTSKPDDSKHKLSLSPDTSMIWLITKMQNQCKGGIGYKIDTIYKKNCAHTLFGHGGLQITDSIEWKQIRKVRITILWTVRMIVRWKKIQLSYIQVMP